MDMIKRFVRYYKPHKRLFMLDTACSLMVAVCDLFYPMIAKNITNVYVPPIRSSGCCWFGRACCLGYIL